jgi:hypothetical protein
VRTPALSLAAASPALSLALPHLRLSPCRTTFSNPTPPEYHRPTLISGDPISSSGFTSWYSSYFCLFFLFVFIFGYLSNLVSFFGCALYFYLKQSIDSVNYLVFQVKNISWFCLLSFTFCYYLFFLGYVQTSFFPPEMTSQAPQVNSTIPGMFKTSISSMFFFLVLLAGFNLLLLFFFFLGYVQASFFPPEMTSQAPQVSSIVPGMFKSSISSILFLGFAC